MKFCYSVLICLILFVFNSCSDEIVNYVVENNLPEALKPYTTYFDLYTLQQRRSDLLTRISDNSLVIVVTNAVYTRNNDIEYAFRPSSTFYYLTGFEEPNAVAIIKHPPYSDEIEFIMFVEEREGNLVNWYGPVYGPDGAVEYFGANEAYNIGQFESKLNEYLNSGFYQNVFSNLDENAAISQVISSTGVDVNTFHNLRSITDKMRVIKSEIEITAIRSAVDVSVQAFSTMISMLKPGMYEYEACTILETVQGINGCPRNAFETIVASGPNINTIHYPAGNRKMLDGDLVMVDYGAEYSYYSADITRTLPVNGIFTDRQKEVYEIVLATHKAVIEAVAPGVNYYALYRLNVEMIIDGLIEKEIISGERQQIILSQQYARYIPAGLGHPIGLDVHDPFVSEEPVNPILQANMIMAFEPHIYLQYGDQTVKPEYWNISVRIEDDLLITADGCERLSSNLPYEISEIEAMMNNY